MSFDVYHFKFSQYNQLANSHVIAYRVANRLTHNAPVSGYSSIDLRGYTRGEYLAPNSLTLELEDRISLKGRWGMSAFVGAATLYDSVSDIKQSDSWFPAVGGGVNYLLKQEEQMLIRLDAAWGKSGKHGVYLQFGTAF